MNWTIVLTQNDIIRKQIGEPTDSITAALLHAEYQYKISDEIRKKHGRKGWIEDVLKPDAHFTPNRTVLARRRLLQELSNDELLEIMFFWFKVVGSVGFLGPDYNDKLKRNFWDNKGITLEHTLESWPDRSGSNLNKLLDSLKGSIMVAYRGGMTQDITTKLKDNLIDFSNTWKLSYRAAFSGIQEVELKGYLSKIKHKGKSDQFDKFGKVYHDATVLEVKLDFIIKDWFGVDEEDVYKNEKSTQMGRDALAAFWILQHQRGYQPFINLIKYTETKDYIF
ncbi:hypothetical protein FACS189426_15080 [Bacteroidia bacterium]|nr:hypothetical protein FACS189426_15080 [Bacteroidia bacterium]GHV70872.1 hypothetical protein FACS189420_3740 [Bacteroidia bacterium]